MVFHCAHNEICFRFEILSVLWFTCSSRKATQVYEREQASIWLWAWRHDLLIWMRKYFSGGVVMAFVVICHHISKYTKPWGHWKLWQWFPHFTHRLFTPAWSPFLADLKFTLRASHRGRTSPTWWSTPHHRRHWTCFGSTPTPLGLTSLQPVFSWKNDICKMKSWKLQTWGSRRHLYFEAL